MKLGFMTFVCPDWTIEEVVRFAAKAGYDGVELRVDAQHKHDVSSQSSAARRKYVVDLFRDAGVEVACIATSGTLSMPDAQKCQEQIDYVKANLDLAADLGAKVVRIFAGGHAGPLTPERAELIAAAYDKLGEYSAGTGVCPMLECGHDIIATHAEAAEVLNRVKTENFGALWNYSEIDDITLETLRPRLRHFHVHDEVLEPDNRNILTLAEKVKPLGYKGYVSLEIIRFQNLPEDLLTETAKRLNGYIAQVYGKA